MSNKFLDDTALRQLIVRIKELIESNSLPYNAMVPLLEALVDQDKIQRIIKLKGSVKLEALASKNIIIPCGFDAYEIKTIRCKNITDSSPVQLTILENDVSNEIIYKSLMSNDIYSNTGDVCNIDDSNKKSVYINITSTAQNEIEVHYEIKLLNLIVHVVKGE
jgi:hypothetical protein